MLRRVTTPFWRTCSRAMATSPEGPPLYRPPTCLRPAVDVIGVRRSSFASRSVGLERLIQPEVLSATSDAVPSSPCGAAVANHRRGFSSDSQPEIIIPQSTVIHPLPFPPQGLYLPESTNIWGGKEPIQEGPKLPVLTQLSFYDPQDVELTNWEDPASFLHRVPAVSPVKNCLINKYDCKPLMMQASGQKLWRSAISLVSLNRRRGYCIARALVEKNLRVSSLYGTFRLKDPIADEISGNDKSCFMGFKQVRKLFITLMKKVYGPNIISDLSLDVSHLLDVLEVGALHEILACYHGALLTPEGRAWLSIKLASIFRNDIIEHFGRTEVPKVQGIYMTLGYLGTGIDAMHPFFGELREYSEDMKKKLSSGKQQQDAAELYIEDQDAINLTNAGYSLVMINQNGVMHPSSKTLSAIAQGAKYTRSDVIQLLHYKMAMYLPVAQALCRSNRYWKWLDMGNCYPEETICEE